MASGQTSVPLTSLLPSPFVLIYAIPMLVIALPVTFVGAFLTLDRTRKFAPQIPFDSTPGQYDSKISQRAKEIKSWLGFEGGVGGLAGGWLFGAYLSTFLSLVIPNNTSNPPLTPVQFLLVHLMSSVLFLFLGARFKIAALALTGVAGGISFALILSVILHPSLLTRIVFAAVLAVVTPIMTLLPIVRTQHAVLRTASASSGAFGLIASISLLSGKSSWQNVWERLWLKRSANGDWGTGIERGFSATVSILLALGIVTDWAARKYIGENPDQKWDSYLAQYASGLANNADRAGSFEPVRSLWQRIFNSSPQDPIKFPSDSQLKSAPASFADIKSRLEKRSGKRQDVKFKPLGDYSDSDSDSESERDNKTSPVVYPPQRPWLSKDNGSSPSLSGATLYDSDDEIIKDKLGSKNINEVEDYSDIDGQDITSSKGSPLKRAGSRRNEPGWKPAFLSRTSRTSKRTSSESRGFSVSSPPPPGAVPMTPSLIRAVDRIAIAQTEAYRVAAPLSPRSSNTREEWKGFWTRVQDKAGPPS